MIQKKVYSPPIILHHQSVQFETAHSWNKGHGNVEHHGNGNGGIHYPNDPYTGPRPDNGTGGSGKGKGNNY